MTEVGCAPPSPLPLRVGVSTRALFDLEAEHAVFTNEGVDAYVARQRSQETARLAKGPGFDAIARLLDLNRPGGRADVDVVLLSRNAPDMALRTFAAIERHGLAIATGSFTSGGPVAPFLSAWGIDLFLSNDSADVEAAAAAGVAAACFGSRPGGVDGARRGELRIAFDGDAVLFSDEADDLFEREGLAAFLRHEREHADIPMAPGPFGTVFRKLAALREACGGGRLRTALVTARSAPAHARAIRTLRSWGTAVDEAHFVGDGEKALVLAAFGAHIFFDDAERHVTAASELVASARVPGRLGFRGRRRIA